MRKTYRFHWKGVSLLLCRILLTADIRFNKYVTSNSNFYSLTLCISKQYNIVDITSIQNKCTFNDSFKYSLTGSVRVAKSSLLKALAF